MRRTGLLKEVRGSASRIELVAEKPTEYFNGSANFIVITCSIITS